MQILFYLASTCPAEHVEERIANPFLSSFDMPCGTCRRADKLTDAILENPFTGIGKPEALKYDLAPKWSRRITQEHRYVYLVADDTLFVYSLKGHYE